ncbi:YSIRK-type signal peptide-containing protein [Lactobacillus gasseri]|nr:YSIRK-type signal peptide-containing protein [Lactobacillus gasseri]
MNNRKYIKNSANARQRFSIRKLTIGTASVLLGTVFYLGVNETTVQAASADSAENEVQTVATSPILKNKATTVKSSETTDAKTPVVQTKTVESSKTDVENKADKSAVQATEVNVDKKDDEKVATKDINSAEKKQQNTQTLDTLKAVPTNTAELNESKVQINSEVSKNSSKILNNSFVSLQSDSSDKNLKVSASLSGTEYNPSQNQTIQMTFQVSNNKAGDQFRLHFDSGAYMVTPTALPSAFGSMNKVQNSDGSYDVTYSLNKSATINQTLSIGFLNEAQAKAMPYNAGTELKNIQIFYNENSQPIKTLTFNQVVVPQLNPRWRRISPSSSAVKKLFPNYDYKWQLTLGQKTGINGDISSGGTSGPSPLINHETTITIPVPESFVLNTEKTIAENSSSATVTQAGKGKDIIVKLANTTLSSSVLNIWGHFDMVQPAEDTTVSGSKEIEVSEDVGAKQPLTGNAGIFKEVIQGSNEHVPVGEALRGYIGGAHNGYDGPYQKGQVPYTASHKEIVLYNYSVGNLQGRPVNDVHLKITVPDGVTITKLVGTNVKDFNYQINYVDNSVKSGMISNGEAVAIENGTNISNIVLTIPQLGIDSLNPQGLIWGQGIDVGFSLYGFVNENYRNGQKVNLGDTLTSDLYPYFDTPSDEGYYTASQSVVAEEKDSITINFTASNYNYAPGNYGGTLTIGGWYAKKAVDPIFYLVMPSNALADLSTSSFKFGETKPKVSSFSVNGYQVVKVDYTGIKITGGDITIYLKNLPDSSSVTTNNGHVYLYAPSNIVKDYSLNEYPTVKDSDVNYVEGKTSALDLGSFNWITQLGQGLTSVELAQGNEDGNLDLNGKSDDKKSDTMTYTVSVINGQKYDIKNTHVLINLPTESSSSFSFVLNENNSVKIIDLNTQQEIAGKISYYSNLSDLKDHIVGGAVNSAKNAKSILVDIDNVPSNHSYRIVLNGTDPTLGYDAGKTGILSSVVWSDNTQSLDSLFIESTSNNASRITISGNSVVNIAFKYKDSADTDQVVAADSIELKNNQDLLSYGPEKVLAALKKLQDAKKIPEDYVVKDATQPQEIINADHGDYPSGIKNEKAQLNQQAKVYFDGDTLVYELVKNTQSATLRFYDDTDHKFIELAPDVNITGKSDAVISFEIPAKYDFSKYKFVMVARGNDPTQSDDKLAGNQLSEINYGKFDNDINEDQIFIAHFIHKTASVKDTKTVTETIHYVYEDGTKAHDDVQKEVTFTKTGTEDLVTGKEMSSWSKPQEFEEVVSSEIAGYTPDQEKINSVTVSHDSKDVVRTVTYKANPQKITVNYIDDTTGKTLSTKDLNGKSDEKSDYATKDSIAEYEKQHYDLVSDETNGSELVFDHDDKVDQVYNVHFTHHMTSINDTKKINETIHYVYEDGTKAHDDINGQPVIFTHDGERDEVTNKEHWNDWKSEKDSFDAVKSPEVAGYTPNADAIPEIKVKPTDSDIVRTVTYKADAQKAKLRFYDDTDHKFIELAPDINTTGKSAESIDFDIPYDFSNYNFIEVDSAKDPADKSNKMNGDTLDKVNYGNFDKDKYTDQIFIAHFTHKIAPVKDTKTVTETVYYVYENGTKAHDDVQKEATFTKTGTKDLVTGEEKSNWSKSKEFEEVVSPEIAGYTPDQEKIDSVTVSHDSKDIVRTVTYKANPQKITVNYVDDTTGKTLATKELNGKSDEKSGYTTSDSIANYEKQHYDLVSDETNGSELIFDHDDKVDQVYNVHLIHHLSSISDTKTINETIHYVYEDGKTASPDVVGTPVVFTRDGERDEVTNEDMWNDWKTKKDSFDKVQSPEIAGYIPNVDAVPEIKVKPTDSDIDRTVTYKADEQKAKLRFYDDTDHKFIELAPDINTLGKSNENISFNVPYNLSNYSFIEVDSSNDPADKSDKLNGDTLDKVIYGRFDKDKNVDQVFIAHFIHKTEPIKDTKVVTETVHYVYEDGTKAHEDVQKQVTFTKTGNKDLVTGKEKSSWSGPQEFSEVISPEIQGYTPDQGKINSEVVSQDSNDIERTVIYKAKPVEPTTPDKPTQPSEPTKPEEPTTPDKPARPTEPTKPEEPTTPDKPAQPSEPTKPEEPITPDKPAQPSEPTKPEEQTISNKSNQSSETESSKTAMQINKSNKSKNVEATNISTSLTRTTSAAKTSRNATTTKHINRARTTLPQTGSRKTDVSLAGLALASAGALIGLIGGKERKRRKR